MDNILCDNVSQNATICDQKKYICNCAMRLEYSDRKKFLQFLTRHLRDTKYIKECSDGVRVNLNVLTDEMIHIIYTFITTVLLKL